MLRLSPSTDTRFEDITGKADFAAGDHLVVPVSAAAESKLQAFCDDLEGFPTDLQSLILNVIRRPSLEWRIHRLERTLSSLPPATQAEQQRQRARHGSFLDRLYNAVMWRVPVGPMVAALLLVASTVAAYDKYFAHEKQAVETEKAGDKERSTTPANSKKNVVDPPEDAQQEDSSSKSLEESLKNLYSVLEASRDSGIQKLYTTHFASQSANSPVLGWGMAKLQALQLGILTTNDSILGSPQNQTGVKAIYNQKGKAALKEHEDSRNLLAWTSCRAFGKPELPKTEKDPNPFPFDKGECRALKSEDAKPGLESLINWVEGKS